VVNALLLCLGTLTVLPVAAPGSVDRRTAGAAMALAPVAGVLLGALAALVGSLPSPRLLTAVLVVAALAVATRAMHLDGLADTADGLGSGKPADGALEVMRRSDIGPFGVVALVLVLLLQVASADAVLTHAAGALALGLTVLASRAVLPVLCAWLPSARPDGLGHLVARSVRPAQAAASLVATVALVVLVVVADPSYPVAWLVAGLFVGPALGVGFAAYAARRLGGITGDVLGAAVEVALTAGLVVLALAT
jgi:adenosylcobinamide-GDP ribazoletransferase